MKASEERRALIDKTALGLFARRGFDAVSMRDIAQACGFGESAIYRHTKSKEELAIRVFRDAYLLFAERMQTAGALESTVAGKLSSYLRIMLEGFDADPELVRFLLVGQHDILAKAISAEDATPLTVLRDTLAEAIDAGDIEASDPDVLCALIMGASTQPLVFMTYGRLTFPAVAHHEAILDGILRIAGLHHSFRSKV